MTNRWRGWVLLPHSCCAIYIITSMGKWLYIFFYYGPSHDYHVNVHCDKLSPVRILAVLLGPTPSLSMFYNEWDWRPVKRALSLGLRSSKSSNAKLFAQRVVDGFADFQRQRWKAHDIAAGLGIWAGEVGSWLGSCGVDRESRAGVVLSSSSGLH